AKDMYGIKFTDEERIEFDKVWDEHGWKNMPMHDGALEACHLLHKAGYELICVTAMPAQFVGRLLEDLRLHEFPIDKVISSGYDKNNFHKNPKKQIIEDLHLVVFVDDLRRNFKDIQDVHTKLIFIDNQYHDDPNQYDQIYRGVPKL
ncbi:unnamed protein product, partial [Rotaria sordida]